ncbi:ferroxidase fet3 [Coemansia sp. BCRC 34962]|nr:ferroxidase fet3 [Coemansia sp. BCRC 34962]
MRRAIGVNGELPIPPVFATKGDTLILNVANSLDETTSVHAHGLFQNGTSYLDGPAMVNQCGIPPGESFSYEYMIDQPGTYWLHGHDHHQNSDGFRAPLVIYDRHNPFEYDEDILLSFEDWYKEEFAERAKITLDPAFPFPPPHGYGHALINGYNGNHTKPIYFQPGKTYRLRLVNMGTLRWFQFTLPGHEMRVIEMDGIDIEPQVVEGLDMAPAQRYSVLVTARNSVEFNYRYNATMYASFVPPTNGLEPRVYLGDIIYREGAPFRMSNSNPQTWFVDDLDLHSLDGEPALPVDRSIRMMIGNNPYSTGQHLDHINNITYSPPKVPTLYTALTMGEIAMTPRVYGPQTGTVILKHMEVVEVTIHNPNDMPHPLHLHGHAFQIIEYGLAESTFPIPAEFLNTPTRRFSGSPAKRDTMSIPKYQYIKLRFRADNPGVWFMHCHLDVHFIMGMAMVFVEAPDVLQKTMTVPPQMLNLCKRQGVRTWGNAAGNDGYNFGGLPDPPRIKASAARVSVYWDVGYVDIDRVGYGTVRGIGANGMLPIPPVRLTTGDTLALTVHNSLNVTTSIHAHGLFQNGTSYMDGPASVAQCGIPPGDNFTYEYVVGQAGTFWLHGHDHHQNSDGLRAPLVVYDRGRPPVAYDEEMLFAFEDWYPETFAERARITLDPDLPFPPEHGYGWGLINGFNGNDTQPIYFTPGRTYRLRLINMSATMWYQFSLPGHVLRVIELDGEYTEPQEADGVEMGPAQRCSVLVTAHSTSSFNYRYNATMFASFIPPAPGLAPRIFIGDIIYKHGAPFIQASSYDDSFRWAKDIDLHAMGKEPALLVDRSLKLAIGNNLYSTRQHLDHINNITYASPITPSLYTALSMGDMAMDERVYGPQPHAIVLKHNEVVELVINNPNALPHPLHLHGHSFQITEYGPADLLVPNNLTAALVVKNAGAPARRDTLVIPPFQYIKVRFRADNPGVWLLHCHMDIHFVLGMAMTFVEAPDVLQRTQKVPPEMLNLCAKQGIRTTGNAAGSQGLDFTGLPPAPTLISRST